MVQVPSLVVLLGLTLCILASHQTMAQQFSESGVVYEAARNKIGLIRYCRNNALLDSATADQAVSAVEAGLREGPPADIFAREQGERAQQAGEDGYWEAGRRRDIAGVAKLFRTTPADLCQEWAGETLRARAPGRRDEVATIAAVPFIGPFQPRPQAEPAPAGPIQADRPPARTTAVVRTARAAPPPPLPERAPLLPVKAELASLQRTVPMGSQLASTGRAVSGHVNGTTASAASRSSGQAAALSARLATEASGREVAGRDADRREADRREAAGRDADRPDAEGLEPAGLRSRDGAVPAAAPSRRLYGPSPPSWWPFNRLGKAERCLMPGCKWSAPQERRAWGY